MSGSLNSPSVIWVAGEAAGKNESGGTASLPTDITPAGLVVASALSGLTTSGYVDAAVAVLTARLVASGVL